MNELCTKGAGELAGIIALGAVSSSEVIEAHLARIEEVNPDLNAATATLADEAREAAAAVDRSVAAGEQVGALAGVPFTVKRTSTSPGRRRRGESWPSPSRSRRLTRRRSRGSERR